jgi:pre-rRNA-processing protein TSR3
MELNSAEAVAASLMIMNEKEQAYELLKRFGWGEEFMRLNGEMLQEYSEAEDSSDIIGIQGEYLEAVKRKDTADER